MVNIFPIAKLLMVIFMFILAGCDGNPPTTMRIGTNYWLGYEPLYLARDLGYLKEAEFHIVEYPSSSEVIRAFRNQAIDIAVLTLDETLMLAQHDQSPRVVMVTDTSNGGDAIVAKGAMRHIRDLVGRRIAVERLGIGAYLLKRALDLNGVSIHDLKLLHLEGNEAEEAYKAGRADAVVTCEPYLSRLVAEGGSVLFDSADIPGEIVDVMVVRKEVLQTHPKQIHTLLSQWYRALGYLRTRPQDAAAKMAVRHHISGEQVLESLGGMKFPSVAETRSYLEGNSSPLVTSGRWLSKMMIEGGLLNNIVDVHALIDTAPIKVLSEESE